MYKKSLPSTSPSLFEGYTQYMKGKRLNNLEDPLAWQNVFYKEITSKIDEDIFSPLYSTGQGRVNAPIRILVSMLILKEGNNWTDEQLFESCDYNLLVLRALGLTNLSDQVPCPSTYYNFKLALLEYENQEGINLLDLTFQGLTKDQIIRYRVSGKNIRMDSKLLHSNVAKTTRLQLALGVLSKFYKSLADSDRNLLASQDAIRLDEIIAKTPQRQTYQLNKASASEQLVQTGQLVFRLYTLYKGMKSEAYELLKRLWEEHFELCESSDDDMGTPMPKDAKKQGGNHLQSAHDPQATYRNKPGSKKQIITGYVCNVTESCSQTKRGKVNPLNLITALHTEPATVSDDKFFKPAVEQTRSVLNDNIENVLVDGAYNSEANEQLSRQQDASFNFLVAAIQGLPCAYEFEKKADGTIEVFDPRNGKRQTAVLTSSKKYRIKEYHGKYSYRYLDEKTIINYFRRKQMKNYPDWYKGMRANTEASIHQLFCKLNGGKTKYRGLFKHQSYALLRAIWVNFRRIKAFSTLFSLFEHNRLCQCWCQNNSRHFLSLFISTKFYSVISMNFLQADFLE